MRDACRAYRLTLVDHSGFHDRLFAAHAYSARLHTETTEGNFLRQMVNSRRSPAFLTWFRHKHTWIAACAIIFVLKDAMGLKNRSSAFVAVPAVFLINTHFRLPAIFNNRLARSVRQPIALYRCMRRNSWRRKDLCFGLARISPTGSCVMTL